MTDPTFGVAFSEMYAKINLEFYFNKIISMRQPVTSRPKVNNFSGKIQQYHS